MVGAAVDGPSGITRGSCLGDSSAVAPRSDLRGSLAFVFRLGFAASAPRRGVPTHCPCARRTLCRDVHRSRILDQQTKRRRQREVVGLHRPTRPRRTDRGGRTPRRPTGFVDDHAGHCTGGRFVTRLRWGQRGFRRRQYRGVRGVSTRAPGALGVSAHR